MDISLGQKKKSWLFSILGILGAEASPSRPSQPQHHPVCPASQSPSLIFPRGWRMKPELPATRFPQWEIQFGNSVIIRGPPFMGNIKRKCINHRIRLMQPEIVSLHLPLPHSFSFSLSFFFSFSFFSHPLPSRPEPSAKALNQPGALGCALVMIRIPASYLCRSHKSGVPPSAVKHAGGEHWTLGSDGPEWKPLSSSHLLHDLRQIA